MKHVVGLFERIGDAESAVRALRDSGFDEDHISVLARETVLGRNFDVQEDEPGLEEEIEQSLHQEDVELAGMQDESIATGDEAPSVAETTGKGALLGGAVGGVLGLLAGLVAITVPGLGPAVAVGALGAALGSAAGGAGLGAAAGGLVGAIQGMSVPGDDAQVYAEGVKRGGVLVSAEVPDERVEAARAIMEASNVVDVDDLRDRLRRAGWEKFDETQLPEWNSPPDSAVWPSNEKI